MGDNYWEQGYILVEGLVCLDVYNIGLAKNKPMHPTMPITIQRQLIIAIGCNTVIHIIRRFKADPVATVANFFNKWAQHGYLMVPIADKCVGL